MSAEEGNISQRDDETEGLVVVLARQQLKIVRSAIDKAEYMISKGDLMGAVDNLDDAKIIMEEVQNHFLI